jgi:TRAP-type C4-dicarboxylate transport system permease small subunit
MLSRIIDGYVRVVGVLTTAGAVVSGAAILAILALVCVEVFLRGFVGTSTLVADEMSGYLNVAVIYFGLAYTLHHGGFVRVDVVYSKLTGSLGQAARWTVALVSFAYVAVLLYYMFKYVAYSYNGHLTSAELSETPLWIPQSLILVGSTLLLLQLSAYIVKRVRDLP